MAKLASLHSSKPHQLQQLDRVGIVLSGLCALHCALTPLLAVGLPVLASHEMEGGIRVGLSAIGLIGIGFGAWQHRSLAAVPWLGMALSLFLLMALVPLAGWLEISLSVAASAALISAHWINTKACRGCTLGSDSTASARLDGNHTPAAVSEN